jgi:hypothetical protein
VRGIVKRLALVALLLCALCHSALAWGSLGHRTVAAIAIQLLPPEKVQTINRMLAKLEMDGNFIDAASYPDEFIRDHDPKHKFDPWHYADLTDEGSQFICGNCLLKALPANLAIIQKGAGGKERGCRDRVGRALGRGSPPAAPIGRAGSRRQRLRRSLS